MNTYTPADTYSTGHLISNPYNYMDKYVPTRKSAAVLVITLVSLLLPYSTIDGIYI